MTRALLPLWLIGSIACTTTVANAQSLNRRRSDLTRLRSIRSSWTCLESYRYRASLPKSGTHGGLIYHRPIS